MATYCCISRTAISSRPGAVSHRCKCLCRQCGPAPRSAACRSSVSPSGCRRRRRGWPVSPIAKAPSESDHDADLIIFDPDREQTVDATRLYHRHPVTPYDGARLRGAVRLTMVGGGSDSTTANASRKRGLAGRSPVTRAPAIDDADGHTPGSPPTFSTPHWAARRRHSVSRLEQPRPHRRMGGPSGVAKPIAMGASAASYPDGSPLCRRGVPHHVPDARLFRIARCGGRSIRRSWWSSRPSREKPTITCRS